MSLECGEDTDVSTCHFIFIFQYIAQTVDMYQWLQSEQISKQINTKTLELFSRTYSSSDESVDNATFKYINNRIPSSKKVSLFAMTPFCFILMYSN